jgi:hypothetical protein
LNSRPEFQFSDPISVEVVVIAPVVPVPLVAALLEAPPYHTNEETGMVQFRVTLEET